MDKDKIQEALDRFEELTQALGCECDYYEGYICPLHNDLALQQNAVEVLSQLSEPKLELISEVEIEDICERYALRPDTANRIIAQAQLEANKKALKGGHDAK